MSPPPPVKLLFWKSHMTCLCKKILFHNVFSIPNLDFLHPKMSSSNANAGRRGDVCTINLGNLLRVSPLPSLKLTASLPLKITIFPGKYHQNCGFSMAMLVSGMVGIRSFPIGMPYFKGRLPLVSGRVSCYRASRVLRVSSTNVPPSFEAINISGR